MEHSLIILSLYDLDAKCSCGRWTMTAPTFDRDSPQSIRDRAHEQWKLHRDHYEGRPLDAAE